MVELLKKVKLTNHKANLPELVEEITKRDREPLKISEFKLTFMIAKVDKSIDIGRGAYNELKNKMRATQDEVNSAHTKLMTCVAEAEKQVAMEVTAIIEEKMQAAEAQLNIVRL